MGSPLRRTLIQLVLVSSPLTAGGCLLDDDGPGDVTLVGPMCSVNERLPEPPSPDLVALVDACEADETQCIELCSAVLRRSYSHSNATSCEVTHDATGHDVATGYVAAYGQGCRSRSRTSPRESSARPGRR